MRKVECENSLFGKTICFIETMEELKDLRSQIEELFVDYNLEDGGASGDYYGFSVYYDDKAKVNLYLRTAVEKGLAEVIWETKDECIHYIIEPYEYGNDFEHDHDDEDEQE